MVKRTVKGLRKGKITSFPIVAIGASAGGVEAITEFVKALPQNTGMAFVYIQHLDPSHKSLLSEIIGRVTKMKVQNARHLMQIERNNIYVIPPNKDLSISAGVLKLNNRQPKPAINMPIDKFFKSLAEAHSENAIGIVLSGNANDGTLGLKEIKNNGGLTFAQDSSAAFQSMPKSAIAEGCVDMILSPKEIALELNNISKNVKAIDRSLLPGEVDDADIVSEDLAAVIELLRRSTGVDFQNYKPNTIKRRIIRRMLLYKQRSLEDYLAYLKKHPNEVNVLFQDLLINVTSFFRDPDTFENLKKSVLPKILRNKTSVDPIRIWVAGCSTGEEAYSLAIIVNEILSEKGLNTPVQIFASDLSENAIAKARIGLYSKGDVAGVSPKRLQKYFTKNDGSYRVNKIIRDVCVYAPHNLLADPPFSRLDLISCCNMMIYLNPVLQKKVLATFHYALKPDGYLVLGKSETLGSSGSLFSQVDKKYKVFSKKNDVSSRLKFEMSYRLPETGGTKDTPVGRSHAKSRTLDTSFEKIVEDLLLARYVAASVVVNKELDILQFHGPIGTFIEISAGKATLNLLKLVRPGLVFDLRNTIHKATKSGRPEKKSGLELQQNSSITQISIEVVPIGKEDQEKVFLIVFEKVPLITTEELHKSSFSKDQLVKKLQNELMATKEDIRSILEEQEASNEELQSANEEIVSSNEELQSINEELETSKEEVESSNEELMTINNELQVRNEQLAEAQEYSEAVSETIREAVLILDKDFRIRSANKAFYRIFKTKEEDTEGMLIYELGNRQWDILELRQLLDEMVSKRSVISAFEVNHDFLTIGRKTMLLHARTVTQKLLQKQLIILAIEDITEHRIAQQIAHERELWFRNMANNAPCMIWMLGHDKARSFSNKTWYEFTGTDEVAAGKTSWQDRVHPDDVKKYNEEFANSFNSRVTVNLEYRLRRADGEYRWMQDVARPYFVDDKFVGYIGTSTELHDKKLMMDELDRQVKEQMAELRSVNNELERSNNELQQFAFVASHDLQEPLRKIITYIDRIQHQGESLSTATTAYFEKIIESSKRMTKLIDDLLDLSTISFSRKEFVKVDLNKILGDVLSDLEISIAAKSAEVIYDNGFPIIDGNALQLSQLFLNLIGNALKFSRENVPARVSITHRILSHAESSSYKELDPLGLYVELRVSDNGIGFNQKFADQIFVIFQRLNEKNKYPGTGIGLALCRRIANNHHGHIYARSSNEGSDFYVILAMRKPGSPGNS